MNTSIRAIFSKILILGPSALRFSTIMNSLPQLCSTCNNRVAEVFCQCTTPETQLCQVCIGSHIVSNYRKEHTSSPISKLAHYKLKVRSETFTKVKDQALNSVAEVDRAIQRYTEEMKSMYEEMMREYEAVIRELNEVKARLSEDTQRSLEEVERTLMEDQPQLTYQYAPAFRWLTENLTSFRLFSYTLLPATSYHPVLFDYHVHTPADIFPREQFPIIYFQTLWQYKITVKETTQHVLAVNFRWGGSFVELDWDMVMCVAGNPATKNVYALNLSSHQLSQLRSLDTPREAPGVVKVRSSVYVFGGLGNSQHLSSCEKWRNDTDSWTPLPGMHYPRAHFTPCDYHSLLYLVSSSDDHRMIETFNPESEVFAVLAVALPGQLALGFTSVAFIAFGELCMLTGGKQMVRWRVDRDNEARLAYIDRDCYSSQQPVIEGNEVLIGCKGKLVKFSLETYSFL